MSTRSASILAEDCKASSVEELLQEARDVQHKKVYLNYKGLTDIPSELIEDERTFCHLQHLYLKRNLIGSLPANIGNLKGLVELYLHSNSLTSLPEEICNLTCLQSLDVSNNELRSLPSSLGKITSLEKLLFPDNMITELPAELGKLENLSVLEASCNQLVSLPVELCDCQRLQSLNLVNNRLRCLPRQLVNLHCLEELAVGGNRLTCLPMDLGRYQERLRTVYVDNNPILHALPFSLWKTKIGATRCGVQEISAGHCRPSHVVKANGLCAILPAELRTINDGSEKVREVRPLQDLCLAAAHRYKDKLELHMLPRSLRDLAEIPVSHCMAPSCPSVKIFTVAWVHLLKLDWAQPWQQSQDSIGFLGLCCSRECLRVFKKIPVPTF